MVGVDGRRRVHIQTEDDFVAFFQSVCETVLPSLEVQLARKTVPPKVAMFEAQRKSGRQPRDHTEQLEDDNCKLLAASKRTERRLDDLDHVMQSLKAEVTRDIETAAWHFKQTQADAQKVMQEQLDALVAQDKQTMADLDVVRKHGVKLDEREKKNQEELAKRIMALSEETEEQFQGVGLKLHELGNTDDEMKAAYEAEDKRQDENFLAFKAELLDTRLPDIWTELQRLEEVKVDKSLWQEHKDKMQDYMQKEFSNVRESLQQTENKLRAEQIKASEGHMRDHQELKEATEAADKQLQKNLDAAVAKLDETIKDLEGFVKAGLAEATKQMEERTAEVLKTSTDKIRMLTEDTQARFEATHKDIKDRDNKIHVRVEELTIKSEKTFTGLNERLEEMVRIERARLAALEHEFTQNAARVQSDLRAEMERLRDDHDQEAARLDADLGDLHMKHDVTKQEFNFFQSRLQEQREWAQDKLTESETALKAAQADAQEGLAASTKMLHALRDDAVGFREKMAKYISVLQHSTDGHGDAIQSLEGQRARMREELNVLIQDHKAYTADMDGWADDVRVKVERVFRSLEPARVEWRICRAAQRAKEMRRPLAVKSPTFNLKGLRQVQLEFFPDGHNNAPDGKAIMRIFLPPNAHMRFQCWIGRASLGSHEFKPGGGLSYDVIVDMWKDQIMEDGAIPVILEVLRDYNSDDDSLTREMRVESP